MRLLPAQETKETSRPEALFPEENGRAASERSGGNVSRALDFDAAERNSLAEFLHTKLVYMLDFGLEQ